MTWFAKRRQSGIHRRPIGRALEILESRCMLSASPLGADTQDTGEFMLGRIVVTPVFLESTGAIDPSSEDWTASSIQANKVKVDQALQWWEDTLANYSDVHSLDFVVDQQFVNTPFPTQYEPISRTSNDYTLWVKEFLQGVGHWSGDLHSDIRRFNDAQRDHYSADWAYTIFVVNAENDADGRFADGGSFSRAFAFAGGRFLVTLSTRPSSTVAHETGHIFYARDEYIGGGTWLQRRGYYDTQNSNAADNPTPGFVQQPSIMAAGILLDQSWVQNLSPASTLAMIGWQDGDGNGVFDVLDVPHQLVGSGDYDSTTGMYRFLGHAQVGRLPNMNSSGLQNDITINRIDEVQYRVNGGSWVTSLTPSTHDAAIDLSFAVPQSASLVEIRTVSRDAGTGQVVTASPIFAADLGLPLRTSQLGVHGFVWQDIDADGEFDPEEAGVGNVAVRLVDDAGAPIATQQNVEPDDYSESSPINNAHPGVTLSSVGIGVFGSDVYVRTRTEASTGTRVFAHLLNASSISTEWADDVRMLRMDFAQPTNRVLLDAVGNSPDDYGRLEAYNASDQMIARYTTGELNLGDVETMQVLRDQGDIAYALAFGHRFSGVRLDNLRFDPLESAVTDALGGYSFPGLAPGQYWVQVQTSGAVTSPATGVFPVAVGGDQAHQHVNFGLGDAAWPWQNPINRFDVDNNGRIEPLDVARILAYFTLHGQGALPATGSPPPYYDVDGNGLATIRDVLDVVGYLYAINGGGGEGGGGEGGGSGGQGEGEGESSHFRQPADGIDDGLALDSLAAASTFAAANKTSTAEPLTLWRRQAALALPRSADLQNELLHQSAFGESGQWWGSILGHWRRMEEQVRTLPPLRQNADTVERVESKLIQAISRVHEELAKRTDYLESADQSWTDWMNKAAETDLVDTETDSQGQTTRLPTAAEAASQRAWTAIQRKLGLDKRN